MSFAPDLYEAFLFRKSDKPLFKVDPRAKAIALIAHVVAVPLINSLVSTLLLLAFLVAMYILLAEPRKLMYTLSASKYILVLLALIVYFLDVGGPYISVDALSHAALIVSRLLILMVAFSLMFTTTHPDDLAQAMVKVGVPFTIAYTLVLSVRFVPTIAKDIEIVFDAQRSRGLELEGGFFKRLKGLIPVLIPAFILTLLRVDKVAEALESRAFGASRKRTFMNELRIGGRDVAYVVLNYAMVVMLYVISTLW